MLLAKITHMIHDNISTEQAVWMEVIDPDKWLACIRAYHNAAIATKTDKLFITSNFL